MRRITPVACLIATALALAACQREAEKVPYELSGRIFVFNYRLAYATYLLTLKRIGAIEEGSRIVASFQNPAGGDPLVIEQKLFPALEKVTLESPHLTCVAKDKPYDVAIRVVGPDNKTVQELTARVISDLDQTVLPAKPLVIGPAYDRNPEVYLADGTVDYGTHAPCPK